MKKIITLSILILCITACKDKEINKNEKEKYAFFGDTITNENALLETEMLKKFSQLKEGDTISVKFKSKINEVCKKKGCWMTLKMPDEKEAFVKFKDYAFFVPKNADGEEAIVQGKAFVSIESIEELKHYAKDAGKSQAFIDSINAPKTTYSFMADGVLIQK